MPLIVTQFHEPNLGFDTENISKTAVILPESDHEVTTTSVTIRRPSDFRRYSLSVQKLVTEKVSQFQGDSKQSVHSQSQMMTPTLENIGGVASKNAEKEPTKFEILEDVDKLLGIFLWYVTFFTTLYLYWTFHFYRVKFFLGVLAVF